MCVHWGDCALCRGKDGLVRGEEGEGCGARRSNASPSVPDATTDATRTVSYRIGYRQHPIGARLPTSLR